MYNQLEEIGALRSAKKHPPRRIGQKRPKKQPEKAALREKGALEKEQHNHEKQQLGKPKKKPQKEEYAEEQKKQ